MSLDLTVIFRDVALTTFKLAMPVLVVSLVVGLAIAIVQAATQINEQTMTFVPKLIAIGLVLLLCGGWMMETIMEFTLRIFAYMASGTV